jgi:molybdopterin molybdotransferase
MSTPFPERESNVESETSPPARSAADVRMRGFARRATVEQVLAWLDAHVHPLSEELVPLDQAAGRVLSRDVISRVDVPGFDRAMMDGFALRAAETDSASTYNPLPLSVVGEILPGIPLPVPLAPGQAVRIMTGAPLPAGADAVVAVEHTQSDADRVWILDPVSSLKHVGRRGEDVRSGDRILADGRRLRPQDLGVLSSIGVDRVPVHRRPRVRLVITGNELLPAGSVPQGAQIADANGPMLAALVERDGGELTNRCIIADEVDSIRQAMHDDVDVVVVSGGSSVGIEDHAPGLLAAHGELAFHGIAMRPSSPTGMGRLASRWVFLLPGNPVSCLCAYDFFAGRTIRRLAGRSTAWPYRAARLPLQRKLVSEVGRVDYARVRIVDERVEPIAVAGASVLTSTTRADGFVIVPQDSEGYPPGTLVEVYLYDE